MSDHFSTTYFFILLLSSTCIALSSFVNSELDNYILYFDEWRFDWDDANDFDTDYHGDWSNIIQENELNHNMFGCTHNLQTIHKKLCILQSNDGDFTFKLKDIDINNKHNAHSNMVYAAKQLSNYYDNIQLKFDDDNDWSSIQSIDGIHGYEAIKKCEPFTFIEICAIYNPYSDNLNVNVKLANFKKRRNAHKPSFKQTISTAHADTDYNDIYQDEDQEISIEDAVSFAMEEYDDTLGYSYWRGNRLGFDQFDEHPQKGTSNTDDDDDRLNAIYGGHTYYFNALSFDWDDSRDWLSFSKQTTPISNAKTEEVGAHPDKLEEVGAHPKQSVMDKDTHSKTVEAGHTPSRSFTKCTGTVPLINKHVCVTVGDHDTHLQVTAATKQEMNILYNGLDDILNEIDIDEDDGDEEYTSDEPQKDIESVHHAVNDLDSDIYDEYEGYNEYEYEDRRRLYDIEDAMFSFTNDHDWDEIIHSYGFNHEEDDNYGRFGHYRAHHHHTISSPLGNMMDNINLRPFRPKLMYKTVPFLFPSTTKCIHTKIAKICIVMDIHRKALKLHIVMPRFAPIFKCIRNPMRCNHHRLHTRKRIFNGIKNGMGLIRKFGGRNRYKKPRKHLKKALKQIRKIRKNLKHLTRQIKKTLRQFASKNIDDNLYIEDKDDDVMAQKVFDINDERGLLYFAQQGTNDFNDIWNDDNQWNAIENMVAWDGRGIRRKCLTLWKKRLCLCQFLGWLDGPQKYHCLFPHHEDFDGYNVNNEDGYDNVHIKNVNPQIVKHDFHHMYGAKQIMADNIAINSDYPLSKPYWMPLWMWQDINDRAQSKQISKLLYSAKESEYNEYTYDDDDAEDDNDEYEAALNEYYSNNMLYGDVDDDIVNLNEIYDNDEEEYQVNTEDNDVNEAAWIELSESATHDFDTEWDDDDIWDDIMDLQTWEGTSIKRKCRHYWKHRLCLCQFLGWMDTNKYQCIYHKRTWSRMNDDNYNRVQGHLSDTKKGPNVVLHDTASYGPIIHHFVPIQYPTQIQTPRYTVHHVYHYGPSIARIRRPRKRKIVYTMPAHPIHWEKRNPIVVHSFQEGLGLHHQQPHPVHGNTHRFHYVPDQNREQPHSQPMGGGKSIRFGSGRNRAPSHGKGMGGANPFIQGINNHDESDESGSKEGEQGTGSSLKSREKALLKREKLESDKEKTFKDYLWQHRDDHVMYKLMSHPKIPVLGNTATGRQMIIGQHINPHGKDLMISMHKHMPETRPMWMPQGLFTNLKHRGYYMVHSHKPGDHSTVTGEENRFVHGSDIAAKVGKYDVYDNYYYDIDDNDADYDYDDEYYYNTQDDSVLDFDAIYDGFQEDNDDDMDVFDDVMDEFIDDMDDEWVVTDVLSAVENAFKSLFSSNNDDVDDAMSYWDSLEEVETKKGRSMNKKCVDIFDRNMCICGYQHDGVDYHCYKKTQHRHKFYLNTFQPKDRIEYMSAHDLQWLRDQRLSAFTEVLPDTLMKHIEYNDLLNIPYNALSMLVHPAVKMEHVQWHKDMDDDERLVTSAIASARRMDDNILYSSGYYDAYDGDIGYINEFGDYIIDEFYNSFDGMKWVVTNEWTQDLNADEMQVFSASTQNAAAGNANNVQTEAERTLSSRCMMVFGRLICLCEFVNWVYDHTGDNPLYKCYPSGSGIEQAPVVPPAVGTVVPPAVGTVIPPAVGTVVPPAVGTAIHPEVDAKLKDLQKVAEQIRKDLDELKNKQADHEGQEAAKAMENSEKATNEGWGSKIDEYDDYANEIYEDYNDYNEYEDSVYSGYDAFYDDDEESDEDAKDEREDINTVMRPNWWTKGEGFSQTVYIGTNTFWGLILLSIFFGMISCSIICGYFHAKRLFCNNDENSISITCTPRKRDQLDPIDEDKM